MITFRPELINQYAVIGWMLFCAGIVFLAWGVNHIQGDREKKQEGNTKGDKISSGGNSTGGSIGIREYIEGSNTRKRQSSSVEPVLKPEDVIKNDPKLLKKYKLMEELKKDVENKKKEVERLKNILDKDYMVNR